jgi:hypothetical protein
MQARVIEALASEVRLASPEVLPIVRRVGGRQARLALVLLGACAPTDDTPGRDAFGGGATTAAASDQRAPRESAPSPSRGSAFLPGGALHGVSARDRQLIAVGRDSAGRGVVFLSNDGARWTQVEIQAPTLPRLRAVVAWRHRFVAFADSGSTILWASSDGRAWTPVRPTPRAFADAGVTDVVAGGPGLVAVGYRHDPGETDEPVGGLVWTSRDGATWTRVDAGRTFELNEGTINSVALGGPGLIAAGADIDGTVVWTSRDGTLWERVPRDRAVFGGTGISAITAWRDGLVAIGARIPDAVPLQWTSRDGRTWMRERADRTFDARSAVSDVSQVAGRLVAVGWDSAGGAIWASDDGRSWTLVAAGSVPLATDTAKVPQPLARSSPDTASLGAHRPTELVEAATAIVRFLRGEVAFDRIRLADTVALYLGREEGGTQSNVPREMLRDRSNWNVRSEPLRHTYSFVPPKRSAELTTHVGRHLNCLDYALSSTFPDLGRFPHVGTTLKYGADSCLQTWNLTLVFEPHERPPMLIAAVYDQHEW